MTRAHEHSQSLRCGRRIARCSARHYRGRGGRPRRPLRSIASCCDGTAIRGNLSGATALSFAMQNGSEHWTFGQAARGAASLLGTPIAFAIACGVVLAWVVAGPMFAYSDTWQLVINTGTTIVTFLMVFLVQNTQN